MPKENPKEKNIFKYFENNFKHFTATQKRFVRYILSNKYEAPFLPAYEIAKEINADSSTLVRFAKSIGYKGYPELQRDFGKLIIDEIRYSGQLEKAKHFKEPKEKNIVRVSLNKAYRNIVELLDNIDEESISLFSEAICSSRKKIIIASRSSYSTGHFLYFELKKILPNVQFLIDYDHGFYDVFEDLNQQDLIIAISVPRYTKITIDFAQYAAQRKLKIASITDSRISPLFPLSSVCLFAPTQSATFHNSNVTLMTLADAIIAQVFYKKRKTAIKRLEREEKILKDQKVIYYEKRKNKILKGKQNETSAK